PPRVAAHTASSTDNPICNTAVATQNAIDVVYELPGLALLAMATVAPASNSRRAGASGCRVDKSHAGSTVATVSLAARASTSSSLRYAQWSTLAAPNRTASCTPGPSPSWFPCTRRPRPRSRAAVNTRSDCFSSKAPVSQKTSTQRTYGTTASSIGPHTLPTQDSAV